jgi:hypothetical protein
MENLKRRVLTNHLCVDQPKGENRFKCEHADKNLFSFIMERKKQIEDPSQMKKAIQDLVAFRTKVSGLAPTDKMVIFAQKYC